VAAPAPEKAKAPPPPPAQTSAATPDTTTTDQPVKASGGALLQIGSYKSNAEAMQSWNAFKARHSVASGYQPDIQKVALGAKGVWYRLRLGGIADKKAAIELCEKLKAQGASCLVAR
jgi:cell division protein FtsN